MSASRLVLLSLFRSARICRPERCEFERREATGQYFTVGSREFKREAINEESLRW